CSSQCYSLHPNFLPFPYTTLFRSLVHLTPEVGQLPNGKFRDRRTKLPLCEASTIGEGNHHLPVVWPSVQLPANKDAPPYFPIRIDRKSTRLNSSHVAISYAVFCLK